jgi:chaperonin GroES
MIENIKILGNRLLVLPDEVITKVGSIYLAEKAVKRPYRGTVVAVGPGRYYSKTDSLVPVSAQVGDRVIYTKGEHQVIEYQGKPHVVLSNGNVIARSMPAYEDINKVFRGTPFITVAGQYVFGWQAVRDVVFIWPDVSDDKAGSFELPEMWRKQKEYGTVLSAGSGYHNKYNKFIPSYIKAGDRVAYDVGTPWEDEFIDAQGDYRVVRMMGYQDIHGVIDAAL